MSHQLWTIPIKYSVTPNQIFLLDCYRSKIQPTEIINCKEEHAACIAKKLLTQEGTITDRGLLVLDEFETFLVKTKKKVTVSVLGDDFLENIKEYRELFPAQRLPTGSLARQGVKELKDKFVWFFKNHPEFNWDIVIDAARYYVLLKYKENYAYMSNSSYFIQKTDMHTKSSKSELADYCQLLIDNPNVLMQV